VNCLLDCIFTWSGSSSYVNNPVYTGYFTSNNEPGGIENATHNTFLKSPNTAIKMYLSDEKTNMSRFMANVIKKLLPLLIYADINIFLKTLRFFTISFDVYVKIYETAQLPFFMFFKSKNKFPL
jgi:hypothetical protein